MTTFVKWFNNPLVLGGLLIIGLIGDLILWGLESDLSKSDWGTWVGSVGTVGALIGTIWLATEERRRRNRESMDLATLAAASLLLRLARMAGAIQRVISVLETDPPPGKVTNFRFCSDCLEKSDRWTTEDLLPLIPLPNHAAASLAIVIQAITTVQMHCENASKSSRPSETADRAELVEQLRIALGALEAGMQECRKQTGVITRRPVV